MAVLLIERGPDSGKRFALSEFPLTVGRDTTNNIVLSDEEVSRFHLRIKKRGRLTILEDLEARNGTFLNGDRVMNAIINSGDKILLGGSELVYLASQPFIELAKDILNFEMVVAEDLGIAGPIEITEAHINKKFKPQRLGELSQANHLNLDSKLVKNLMDFETDVITITDLEEAMATLLKSLHKLLPKTERAVVFTWLENTHQLIPSCIKHFQKTKNPFTISHRALEDVIARKQGIILEADSGSATHNGQTRLVLPMVHHDRVLALVHMELKSSSSVLSIQETQPAQSLINRCAASMDSMLLRKDLDSWLVGMVDTLVATVEAKDTYTRGHSERVSRFSMAIAEELKLAREIKKLLMISSLCHDIGKIGVPDIILKKAGILSAEEYNEMKLHPTLGAEIILNMPNAKRFLGGIKHHHEKWDGTGYPDGLAGEDIPFFGRIVGLADVFDAMISGRSYSGFIDQAEAVDRLNKEKDLFDPQIVRAFTKAYESGRLTLKTQTLNQENPEAKAQRFDLVRFGQDSGVYGGTRGRK